MHYRKEGMNMGVGGVNEWAVWRTDVDVVREVKQVTEDALQ